MKRGRIAEADFPQKGSPLKDTIGATKFQMGYTTLTTPLQGWFVNQRLTLHIAYLNKN